MKIEVGKSYWNGNGKRYFIAGITKEHVWIAYSRCGDWFDINTGQYVSGLSILQHASREPIWRDLWSEASPE